MTRPLLERVGYRLASIVANPLNDLICRVEKRRREDAPRRPMLNERPVEYGFVFRAIRDLQPRSVLDVGTGQTALPSLVESCGCWGVDAVDNVKDYWRGGLVNRHQPVDRADITARWTGGQYDMVLCISTLEHIRDDRAAVVSLADACNPGGHVIITCPYNEATYVENVYDLPNVAYGRNEKYICRSYSRASLDGWRELTGLELSEIELWQFWTGPVWRQGEPIQPIQRQSCEPHQLACLRLRKPAT